jgi:DNA ligase-1
MNRFAALLDRLAYEPRRNAKLRLMADYFRDTPDPERGFALAALTGVLSFKYAKPNLVRTLIGERTDPYLFQLSRDYVGDMAETVALMWPAKTGSNYVPTLSEIVTGLHETSKLDLPNRLASWLDALDETGRWALLKLITGSLRVGVTARLAKTAVAGLGDTIEPNDVEHVWPGLKPP